MEPVVFSCIKEPDINGRLTRLRLKLQSSDSLFCCKVLSGIVISWFAPVFIFDVKVNSFQNCSTTVQHQQKIKKISS